jgi:hypothetical protein
MGGSLKSLSQVGQQLDARPYFLVERNQELRLTSNFYYAYYFGLSTTPYFK